MEYFAMAVKAVYDFMHIRFNIGKYNISFWEIMMYTIITSALWFIVRQHLDVED